MKRQPWKIEDKLTAVFFAASIALLLAAVLGARSVSLFVDSSRRVTHTFEVLEAKDSALAALMEAIADERSFVITAERTAEARYKLDFDKLAQQLMRLAALTIDDPVQHARAMRLHDLAQDHRKALENVSTIRQSQSFAPAQAAIERADTHTVMKEFHALLDQMEFTERELLKHREQLDQVRARQLFISVGLLISALMIGLIVATLRSRRELIQRAVLSEKFNESRNFLGSIFDNIPVMVFVKRASDFKVVRINRAGRELIGLGADELKHRSVESLFGAELSATYRAADQAALAGSGVLDIHDEQVPSPRRGMRTLHTRRIRILDQNGTPAYVLGISEDVTERNESENKIRVLNDSLAQKNLALEVTNKELESFSYSVSHDLRSPLRAIDSFATMLQEDYSARLDAEGLRFLQVIRDASRRMNRLIDDLLAFSRIGRQSLKASRVDMQVLVREVIDEHTRTAVEPHCRFEVDTIPACLGDRNLLRQVWDNLIANAIKYSSKQAAPEVAIGLARSEAGCHYFVRDNGAGFDMRYYDKLFGVFQRLHHDSEFPGTGVGLAIVQRVVVRHGGRVWAESEIGRGACFNFTLPMEEAP